MEQFKKRIMIDLDGVLNNYTKYDENYIPPIREGAAEFLNRLCSLNKYELILFTTRPEKLAEQWLGNNKINHYFKEITNIKKPASIYIDDRALKFEQYSVYWKK